MNRFCLSTAILFLSIAGCTDFGSKEASNEATMVPVVSTIPGPDETPVVKSESLTMTATSLPTSASQIISTASPAGISIPPDVKACALIPQEKIKDLLGEDLMPPQDFDSICIFPGISESRSLTINISRGEVARLNFLNIIAQHKKGCSLSFSSGTDNTPTPFPPEVMQLNSKSLAELAGIVIEGYGNCDKDDTFSVVTPTLGDGSFLNLYDFGFIQSAILTVVSSNQYVDFTLASHSSEEIQEKKDAFIHLVATSLAEAGTK